MLFVKLIIQISLISMTYSANILCFFYVPSKSHQIGFQAIWRELALRGHNVTVITTDPLNDPTLTNVTEINTNYTYRYMEDLEKHLSAKETNVFQIYVNFYNLLRSLVIANLNHPEVLKIIMSNNSGIGFDVVISECWHPLAHGLAAHFNAPSVVISSLGVVGDSLYEAIGNPVHTSFYTDIFFPYQLDLGLWERFASFYFRFWHLGYYRWVVLPEADGIMRRYFQGELKYLGDLEKDVSLILVSSSSVHNPGRANVPRIIEIGGVHVKKERGDLPEDLAKIMSEATNGIIYVSFGSMAKTYSLPHDFMKTIIETLSELAFTVLLKWDDKNITSLSQNIITRSWFPQQDILGHPNIKVFITQGGLQSTSEAISRRVPMIMMPMFSDQFVNTRNLVKFGVGVYMQTAQLNKEILKRAILDVATNKTYRTKVEEVANLLEDQPMTGLEKAIWWIEYVLRHKGAKHLKSPLVDLPFYQLYYLDLFLVKILFVAGLFLCLKCIITNLFSIKNKLKVKVS